MGVCQSSYTLMLVPAAAAAAAAALPHPLLSSSPHFRVMFFFILCTFCSSTHAAGKPLFGTLISLLHNGVPVLGLIDQPVTRERWVGLAGQQSSLNGRPISTRACGDISNAYMYSTTPHMFAGETEQVGGWGALCWVKVASCVQPQVCMSTLIACRAARKVAERTARHSTRACSILAWQL
jgi:hypothetical protein